jgi:hypothetical protein
MPRAAFPSGLALLVSVGLMSCEITEASDDCTSLEESALDLNGTSAVFENVQLSIGNGLRRLEWVTYVDNLCVAAPTAQNKVDFLVVVEPGSVTPQLTVTAFVQPAFGYQPYKLPLTKQSSEFKGTISNIGLRQGSHDGRHGYAEMRLWVEFVPNGTTDAGDINYAKSFLNRVRMTWHFQRLSPD